MSTIQAEWLLQVDRIFDELIDSRRKALKVYADRFAIIGDRVRMHLPPEDTEGNAYLAVFSLHGKDGAAISSELAAHGIQSARIYPETVDMQIPAARAERYSELRNSREFCRKVINLPLFHGITPDELQASAVSLERSL